jgi:hypothetical protein
LSLKNGKTWDLRYEGAWPLFSVDWAVDGKSLFGGGYAARGGVAELLRIDFQGNAQPLWKTAYPVTWAIPSPDGRRLAIEGGTQDRNVWMLENF